MTSPHSTSPHSTSPHSIPDEVSPSDAVAAAATTDLADDTAPSDRRALLHLVPHDPWYRARLAAMAACTIAYLWFSRTHGLVTDRISAAGAVGVFLVCAFVGKPWRRWGQVAVDAACYASMWFMYENTRGAADGLGLPLQMNAVRSIDRVLFLGGQPTEWIQRHWYEPGIVRWYDRVLSLVYYSHFVVPVMAVAAVWAVSRTMWGRYMRRFVTIVTIACTVFVLLPTVPPWMASDARFGFGVGEPLVRHTHRGLLDLGFTGFANRWHVALDWSNAVAAMPSLHAAFSLFVVVFFMPMIRPQWARVAVFAYPVTMAVALVYFAEHWVIDVLAGWALVVGSFALWNRLERSQRERAVAAAIAGRPALAGAIDTSSSRALRITRVQRDPEMVVFDRSALEALADAAHPRHGEAAACFAVLLDRYLDDQVRLAARRDHLEAFDMRTRCGALAPMRAVHVAAQHRRQATRLAFPAGESVDEPDERLTLVIARRERAASIVSVDRAAARAASSSNHHISAAS